MKFIIFVLLLVALTACTETVVTDTTTRTIEKPMPDPADEYSDIQTAEDDFRVMEETLDLLE